MGGPTKPKAPSRYAGLARNMVGNGKPSLGSGSPAWHSLYQTLPAATINRVICYYHSHSTVSSCASWDTPSTSETDTYDETSFCQDTGIGHSDDRRMPGAPLLHRHILLLRFIRHLVAGVAPRRPTPWPYDSVDPISVSEASVW